ncbi:MAG: hypothetical protein ACI4NE_04720 [Succinivibrio sp.]
MKDNSENIKKDNPYADLPLKGRERLYFNLSALYLTLVSSFVFALLMSTMPSFTAAVLGLVWAIPGFLILCGFYQGRAKRRIRTFHNYVFASEVIFLLFILYFIKVALSTNNMIGLFADVLLFVFYILAAEFGILRAAKRHVNAYYDEKLKDRLCY